MVVGKFDSKYQWARFDMNNRTCLQIMAQNRLYQILRIDGIGNIIIVIFI